MKLAFKQTVLSMIVQRFPFAHILHTGSGRKDQSLDVDQHF